MREQLRPLDELEVPDDWAETQRRSPRHQLATRPSLWRRGTVIATALAITIATTGIMIRAFDHGMQAEPVTTPPNGWPAGTVPALGLSYRYPPGWRFQPFAEEIGTIYFQGVLISNTDLAFDHPMPSDGGATSAWDLSRLPVDGLVISIEQISGGPASNWGPSPPDTALPLSLSEARLLAPQPDPLGSSPKPAGTEERLLDFVLNGQSVELRVFFAPQASAQTRAAAADVVASIASAVHVPTIEEILSGRSATGPELAAQLGLKLRKVSDIQGPKAPANCYSFVGISRVRDTTKDVAGYCIHGLTADSVHLYALAMALRDTIPSRAEFERMAANIRSGEAGDLGTPPSPSGPLNVDSFAHGVDAVAGPWRLFGEQAEFGPVLRVREPDQQLATLELKSLGDRVLGDWMIQAVKGVTQLEVQVVAPSVARVAIYLDDGSIVRGELRDVPGQLIGPAKVFVAGFKSAMTVEGTQLHPNGYIVAYDAGGTELDRRRLVG